MKKVSIVIPALNEAEGIGETIKAIPRERLEALGYQVQFLVVDNGSSDGTGEVARRAGAEVVLEPRRGYGYAVRTGFAHADGEVIATTDADATYPVEELPTLVESLDREGLDFISTNRFAFMDKRAMSLQHKLGNAILNLTTRLLFGVKVSDSQTGMMVIRRGLLERMRLRSKSFSLNEEIHLEACSFLQCRWREFPISYKPRLGKSKLRSWPDGLANFFFLIRKRFVR